MDAGRTATRAESAWEPGEPRRPGAKWKLLLVGLIGAFAVLAVYGLVSTSGSLGSNGGASISSTTSPAAPSRTERTAAAVTPASAPASRALSVASVVAFGPDGISDGDNPGIVARINGGGQPWYSSWYATPEFGDLQAGTGLLLDMGKPVTVSSVQLALGSQAGADVQVRVGDTAVLADLITVATASDVSGTVRLPAAIQASGRYVLIWFTALPPNGQGKYQVSVYGATVDGTDA